MYHFVYKTTNLINGKSYIGKHSSNSLDDSYLGSGTVLRRAIKKYGKQNFKREILEFCDSLDIAYKREEFWIKEYNSVKSDSFYNVTNGGFGNKGYVPIFTDEHRRKISEALTGKKLSEEHKRNVSKGGKGRIAWNKGLTGIYSKETRKNISENNKKFYQENPISQETRDKISKALMGRVSPMKGRKQTEEAKQKIKNSSRGQEIEIRKKISDSVLNRKPIKCPYCDVESRGAVIYRYHFENCKNKIKINWGDKIIEV